MPWVACWVGDLLFFELERKWGKLCKRPDISIGYLDSSWVEVILDSQKVAIRRVSKFGLDGNCAVAKLLDRHLPGGGSVTPPNAHE